MGMMGKLKETQQKVEETKKRLDFVLIDEKSADGLLEVTLTANRKIKNITVSDDLLQDKEMLEDYLVNVLNKAIEKAAKTTDPFAEKRMNASIQRALTGKNVASSTIPTNKTVNRSRANNFSIAISYDYSR